MIYIDINKLKTNEDNPRIIKDYEFKKLCKSIQNNKKFFESRPVIVDHYVKTIQTIHSKKIDMIDYLNSLFNECIGR
jgi:hypothetical protein